MNTATAATPAAANPTEDPRWRAVVARDRSADGAFFYSVRTTGVYCRPSCAARRANLKNVQFHSSAAEAERAGFRPCKRCRPGLLSLEQQHAATVVRICREIDTAEEVPQLAELARRAGLSPYHFHRVFKSITGITPRAYAAAQRAGRVRIALDRAATVTDAIYDAGFNSGGRFYESSSAILGMKPRTYRAGGVETEIRFAVGECSLGSILVAQSATGICAILLGDDPNALVKEVQDRFRRATLVPGDQAFERTVAAVVAAVEAPAIGLDLPLDVRGTAFQERVWRALRNIPPGSTASYGEVARSIGAPTSPRAVARACAANTVAVAIPCHRVVGTDGGLSGYRWGIERKRELLARERTR